MEYAVEQLEGAKFEHYWPAISKEMVKIPHTWKHWTLDSVYERVMASSLQVWGVGDDTIKMVLFTQVACHPTGNVLEVVWAFGHGSMEAAKDIVNATMEHFAQLSGCVEIQVIGRQGWERVLKDWGFERTAVIMSRPVQQMRIN